MMETGEPGDPPLRDAFVPFAERLVRRRQRNATERCVSHRRTRTTDGTGGLDGMEWNGMDYTHDNARETNEEPTLSPCPCTRIY